eukprot:g5406.t1
MDVGGGVVVQPSGCLGNCSQAPNVLLVTGGRSEKLFPKRSDASGSAEVVQRATGRSPNLDDAAMVARLQRARRLRVRTEAREQSKWNLALAGLREDLEQAQSSEERAELAQEYAELLAAAGFGERALEVLSAVASLDRDRLRLHDIPTLRVLLDLARILAHMGRAADIYQLRHRVGQLIPRNPRECSTKAQVDDVLVSVLGEVVGGSDGGDGGDGGDGSGASVASSAEPAADSPA